MGKLVFPVSTDMLIPQKYSMRFVHFATVQEGDTFSTVSEISRNIFHLEEGLDPVAGIEFMAQSCAALNGYRNRSEGHEEKLGFLAGITEFNFPREPIPGDTLEVLVKEDSVIPPFTLVSGILSHEDGESGNGRMKVYEVDDNDSSKDVTAPTFSTELSQPAVPSQETLGFIRSYNTYAGAVSPLEGELLASLFKSEGDYKAVLPPGFIGFDGHFPDNPIFPGVMMIKLLQLILSLEKGTLIRLQRITRVKFGNLVFPQQEIRFEIKDLADNKGKFRILTGETVCASGNWEAWD